MAFKNITVCRRITLGFGLVLALLLVAGLLSYTGVGGIVGDATEVIDGNKLDGSLAQIEVDHRNWVNKVNALPTDDKVTKLDVQTDPHKCRFGKWLYGPRGANRPRPWCPAWPPLLKKVEDPHAKLHASAVAIGKVYQPADSRLPGFVARKYVDHLKWSAVISQHFLANGAALEVQTDPHKCAVGKWCYSEATKKAMAGNPELAVIYAAIEEPHRKLHESAVDIQKVYRHIHPGLLFTLVARMEDHHKWVEAVSKAIILDRKYPGVQADPTKCGLGKWLASDETKAVMASFPALQ